MLSQASLEEIASRLRLSAPVRFVESTGSTNATALELAEAGAPEWTLVAAGHQTAGRGRLGRAWRDRPGSALLFSFVLRPSIAPELAGAITQLAGVSVATALEGSVGCKWPNDLVTTDGAHHKVGGVLAEAIVEHRAFRHVVVGVGVNLGEPPEVPGAASVGDADPGDLLAGILRTFRGVYEEGERLPMVVHALVPRFSVTLGRRVRARVTDGRVLEGTAVEIDQAGGLVLETPAGRATVAFGDVEHLREGS